MSSSSTCIGFNTQLHLHHVRSRIHTLKVPDCSSTRLHFQFQPKHAQITRCLQLRCVRSDDNGLKVLYRTFVISDEVPAAEVNSGEVYLATEALQEV